MAVFRIYMLTPKKQKYRKMQKGRVASLAKGGTMLAFGSHGLKSLGQDRINSRQIEAARKAASRYVKRQGKLWIKIFPDIPVSKKPAEARMGKGKSSPEYFICRVAPGKIIFEIDGVEPEIAKRALVLAAGKLPVKTMVVSRHD